MPVLHMHVFGQDKQFCLPVLGMALTCPLHPALTVSKRHVTCMQIRVLAKAFVSKESFTTGWVAYIQVRLHHIKCAENRVEHPSKIHRLKQMKSAKGFQGERALLPRGDSPRQPRGSAQPVPTLPGCPARERGARTPRQPGGCAARGAAGIAARGRPANQPRNAARPRSAPPAAAVQPTRQCPRAALAAAAPGPSQPARSPSRPGPPTQLRGWGTRQDPCSDPPGLQRGIAAVGTGAAVQGPRRPPLQLCPFLPPLGPRAAAARRLGSGASRGASPRLTSRRGRCPTELGAE